MLTQPHGADLIAFWQRGQRLPTKKIPDRRWPGRSYDKEEAPAKRLPNRGFQAWVLVEGDNLYRVILSKVRGLQRVVLITVQCKTREPKREAPRGDCDLLGAIQGQA